MQSSSLLTRFVLFIEMLKHSSGLCITIQKHEEKMGNTFSKKFFIRAIACKPRPNAQDVVQLSFLDLTNFHIYDRAHCLMNFDVNRIKKY